MIKKLHRNNFRMRFLNPATILLLISGIILLGYTSCRTRPVVKYGGPPAGYKQMEKNN